jgi:hypothetical protein
MFKNFRERERCSFYKGLLRASQPHLRPLILAARDGGIVLGLVRQNAGPGILPGKGKPVVTIIGDDPGISFGPDGFDRNFIGEVAVRAKLAIVNAWALERELYNYALAMATGLKWDVLLIETRRQHEQAWISVIETVNPEIRFVIVGSSEQYS